MPLRIERLAEPIPGYTLLERLGGGGFGEVWKAEAPGGIHKAIKFVYGELEAQGEEAVRAKQEQLALNRVKEVRHPFILSLERIDIIENRLIIVMELADRTLWDRFRECQQRGLPGIPREELLGYMHETAEALDLMNIEHQLQHLDIKPQNLFLVHQHVKVADFGLVKDLQGVSTRVTGGVTPVYAAPETFDGRVSRFCDQYSLAIVYQELLTGQRPFKGNNVHQLILDHIQREPNVGSLAPADQRIIRRALAKKPEDRYPSCQELSAALRGAGITALAADAVPIVPPPGTPQPGSRTAPTLSGRNLVLEREMAASTDAMVRARPAAAGAAREGAEGTYPSAVPTPRQARVEGEGELFPALVIGLGGAGLIGVQQLRAALRDRFGSPEALPNVHFLYLDTDAEALQATARDRAGESLPAGDSLLVRLNRPRHFLQSADNRARIDSWLPQAMLYRIPRNQVTAGVRALGRLAFVDNHRALSQRLRGELEACCDASVLIEAARNTGLALRSNQPRIYVIASLGGGTGGGMFIDLAYLLRGLTRELGIPEAEVIGLFSLPAAVAGTQTRALGNAFAALTELHHFSAAGEVFRARYDPRGAAVQETGAPYSRCVFLCPTGETTAETASAGLAGEFLADDLTTPLGRAADALRTQALGRRAGASEFRCQTFGLFRFSWPRRLLLDQAARRYCRQLVEHWMTKNAQPVADAVRQLVQEQWAERQLGADTLILRFQDACARALGQAPEDAFAAAIDAVASRSQRSQEFDPELIRQALAKLEQLVGRPSGELSQLHRPALLEEALQQEAEPLMDQWEQTLAPFTTELVEAPEFRLAGAEEATRQAAALIEEILKHHEPLLRELAAKALQGYERLQYLLTVSLSEIAKGGRRGGQLAAELLEMLRQYPKWRYQAMVLRRVTALCTGLRGYLSDQVRELNFYRDRLSNLQQSFQTPVGAVAGRRTGVASLLPAGCSTPAEALDLLFPLLSPDETIDLDRQLQPLIQQHFKSLENICTTPANSLRSLEGIMVSEVVSFVKDRLEGTGVVEVFQARYPKESEVAEALRRGFDEAEPRLAGADRSGAETAALVVPGGDERQAFRDLAARLVPAARLIISTNGDHLVFYRERPDGALADLEQVGPAGEEAYRKMMAAEHFTPHTRVDITTWRPVAPR